MFRTILLAVVVLLSMASRGAWAGRNNNGALIVHTDDAVAYSAGDDYCSTIFTEHAPADCAGAITRTDRTGDQVAVIWFLAAFTEQHHSQVTGIQFGVDHNLPTGLGQVSAWASCGTQELPQEGWPSIPSGNLVAFGAPVTDRLFPFYWFAVSGSGAGTYFGTGPDPALETPQALLSDASAPAVLDEITRFGRVEWGAPGFNECPEPPLLGGCCFESDARCEVVDYLVCADSAGVYMGDGSGCGECRACCYSSGESRLCIMTIEEDCSSRPQPLWSGDILGAPRYCNPDSGGGFIMYCPIFPATRTSTWGELKALFR